MSVKRFLVSIMLIMACVLSLFAVDGEMSGGSFRLRHVVSEFEEHGFQFWDSSSRVISSKAIEGDAQQQLGILMFLFTSNSTDSKYSITSLKLSVSDMCLVDSDGDVIDIDGNKLTQATIGNCVCYPFDFWVTDPNTGSVIGSKILKKADGDGSYKTVTIVSSGNPLTYQWDPSSDINTDEMCKIWVLPYPDEAAVGNYMATVRVEVTY